MNAALLALLVFAFFALAKDEPVPSRELADGIDYVPTQMYVLWGHHYTSIAGAAPIMGPAIAVIWGWLPALLWVGLGTVFMGAAHDFAALVISLRNRGRSIGEVAGSVINPRVRTLFLLIISFLIWIVLAVFAFVIGTLFHSTPGSIFPINVQILLAIALGWLVYRRRIGILAPSLVAYALLAIAERKLDPYGHALAAAGRRRGAVGPSPRASSRTASTTSPPGSTSSGATTTRRSPARPPSWARPSPSSGAGFPRSSGSQSARSSWARCTTPPRS